MSDMPKHAKILILDDEPANVRLLERILELAGYTQFKSTTDSRRAIELFRELRPDLVMTDLHMPFLDGFAVMEQLRNLIPANAYLPFVVLTADMNPETRRRALAAGAHDFLIKPFDHMEVVLRVSNLLRTRMLHTQLQGQNAILEEAVGKRTLELQQALAELQAAQGHLVQQERLRALGTMAGGIAHDFNNSLASILGYSELLLMAPGLAENPEKSAVYLRTIMTAAQDAARMVRRLREFSHPTERNEFLQAVQLNDLVKQAISLSMPKWKNGPLAQGLTITVGAELGDIPEVQGDAAELREALINLIFNAVDALPAGGAITIRTKLHQEGVRLEVADTGVGMTEEIRQRCLEPYFTTKGNRGTGLGLAMVYGIIHRHAGKLEIQSKAGEGTTFILDLPRTGAPAGRGSALVRRVERPLRILVVDDQPMICEFLTECLRHDQHSVVTAGHGREGLEKFRGSSFDVVVTDQAMPEMDGRQLASSIRQLKPQQPIILLTGYGDHMQAAMSDGSAFNLILGKPISIGALRQALVEVVTE